MKYLMKVAELYCNNDDNKKEFEKVIRAIENAGYTIVYVNGDTIEVIKEMGEQ